MKAVVCERPGTFVRKEVDEPRPAAGEALVRIRRVGICGTDLHAFQGNQPFFEYPRIIGHELAAVVEHNGGREELKRGEPVTVLPYIPCGHCIACRRGKPNCCVSLKVLGVHVDGGLQELLAVPAGLLVKAEGLSLDQLALVECFSIGAHAVRRAGLEAGETVLVLGAGPIGIGLMYSALAAGCRVLSMDVNTGRLSYCREVVGVQETIDAGKEPERALAELTGGELPTTVFDATGNPGSMMKAFGYIANGGTLVFVSVVQADISFSDPDFQRRETTLLSSRNATIEDFQSVIALFASGKGGSDTFITHRSDLDSLAGEIPSWLDPQSGIIKAMISL